LEEDFDLKNIVVKKFNQCLLGFVFICIIIPFSTIYKLFDKSPKFRKSDTYWISRKNREIFFGNEF
jgi:hypothetical protein